MVKFYKKDGSLRKKAKIKVIDRETLEIEYCGQIIRFKEFSSDLDAQILDYIKKNTNE